MESFSRIRSLSLWLATALLVLGTVELSAKERRPASTTAFTAAHTDYKRERLPDGRWKVETYAFGEGSLIDPTERDDSLTALTFGEVLEMLVPALAKENYLPGPSEGETELMIVVSWGRTLPFDGGIEGVGIDGMSTAMNSASQIMGQVADRGGAGATAAESSQLSSLESEMTSMMMIQDMADRDRRRANDHNARLLGYAPALYEAYESDPLGMQRNRLDDLLEEIESPRYFVILQAYDFQKLVKEKQRDLRWITRFSIRANGRRFDEELANMASAASSLFGNGDGKLKRGLRPGTIEMGELQVIDVGEDVGPDE